MKLDTRILRIEDLLKIAKKKKIPKKLVVAAPHDHSVLASIKDACQHGLIEPILVGSEKKIKKIAADTGLNLNGASIINKEDVKDSICEAVNLISHGSADILMKGLVATASLIHAVLDKEIGLRKSGILSHVGIFNAPGLNKIMLLTDAGINIRPNLQRKLEIVRNAVKVSHILGIKCPKVAMLAAVEKINYPAMPATLDAMLIAQMAKKGLIKGAVVEGPLALDNAVSKESAQIKGIGGEVAGNADILCVPDIESGNILYKSLTCFSKTDIAGVVVGGMAPVVVCSRADSEKSKLLSIAISIILSEEKTNI